MSRTGRKGGVADANLPSTRNLSEDEIAAVALATRLAFPRLASRTYMLCEAGRGW